MATYIIFVKTPINMRKAYYQNSRRGEKAIEVTGTREEMLRKVEDLKKSGEVISSVRTALGGWVKF